MTLLAVDIGNTNIDFGIFKGNKTIKKFIIPTKNYNLGQLRRLAGKADTKDVVICSVVPATDRILERDIRNILKKRPLVLGRDIAVPLKNLYRRPGQVGQDRLVNAYAAFKLYGPPLIVVDFGTAITIDAVSRRGEYLGGMIIPGLELSLLALAEGTALLPAVKLNKPRELVGRDTRNSILSGVVHGFVALVEGLADKIKNELGRDAKVIATGGNSGLIAGYSKSIDKINKDLTLIGLNLVYKNIKLNN